MILKSFQRVFVLCVFFLTAISCDKRNPEEKFTPTVHIEEKEGRYQLVRNGEPFYIKGGAASSEFLEELKEAGANTARIYDTTNLGSVLDRAEALDLAVVVDIPLPKFDRDPQFYEDPELFEPMFRRVKRVVNQHKDHPALLYWNLGNEIYYPYFYKNTPFHSNYNSMLEWIKKNDLNHPISTATIGANKLLVLSIRLRSPELDFISFNSFGTLSSFSRRLKPIQPLWNGPHVISEWGVNGQWEARRTSWDARIEESSKKKAEQIVERHHKYIEELENSFGSFVFYWGQKDEATPTWYSLFDENHLKSEAVFKLENIWKNRSREFPGPELHYILLNKMGAADDIILPPATAVEAEALLGEVQDPKSYSYFWELRPESWYHLTESRKLERPIKNAGKEASFYTPSEEGPYRLFLHVTNGTEYFASSNIPFYVLDPEK